jgi:hypothetical protein
MLRRMRLVMPIADIAAEAGVARQCLSKDLHRYDNRLSVLTVDVDDTPENWEWIRHFTSHLLQRFEQLEIYVTSYLIVVV